MASNKMAEILMHQRHIIKRGEKGIFSPDSSRSDCPLTLQLPMPLAARRSTEEERGEGGGIGTEDPNKDVL